MLFFHKNQGFLLLHSSPNSKIDSFQTFTLLPYHWKLHSLTLKKLTQRKVAQAVRPRCYPMNKFQVRDVNSQRSKGMQGFASHQFSPEGWLSENHGNDGDSSLEKVVGVLGEEKKQRRSTEVDVTM